MSHKHEWWANFLFYFQKQSVSCCFVYYLSYLLKYKSMFLTLDRTLCLLWQANWKFWWASSLLSNEQPFKFSLYFKICLFFWPKLGHQAGWYVIDIFGVKIYFFLGVISRLENHLYLRTKENAVLERPLL